LKERGIDGHPERGRGAEPTVQFLGHDGPSGQSRQAGGELLGAVLGAEDIVDRRVASRVQGGGADILIEEDDGDVLRYVRALQGLGDGDAVDRRAERTEQDEIRGSRSREADQRARVGRLDAAIALRRQKLGSGQRFLGIGITD
jgi:hypothetical protein